eukprot:tig00000826_g4590.t1
MANAQQYSAVAGVGLHEDRNPRYRRTMEDATCIIDKFGGDPDQAFFAVYDGHGGRGPVDFLSKRLHQTLLEELQKTPQNVQECIKQAYLKTDQAMRDHQYAGTTAVTALIRKQNGVRTLYIANAGDSRCVLCRNGKSVRLSYDHKASDPVEAQRCRDTGAFVVNSRVNGVLSVTRAFGDHAMKNAVTADPYITEVQIQPEDQFFILACDGLWDVLSDQQAVDLIKSERDPSKMAELLVKQSLSQGSTDNVTAMVIRFCTLQSLKQKEVTIDAQWLTYWLTFAVIHVVNVVLSPILVYIPLYWELQIVILLWLQMPNFNGNEYIRKNFVTPYVETHDLTPQALQADLLSALKNLPAHIQKLKESFAAGKAKAAAAVPKKVE